jgi:hypothetical protein
MGTVPAKILGRYYLVTGIWPLLNRRSFEAVTGPKHDFWLARAVGILVIAIGLGLERGTRGGRVAPEVREAALLGATGLVGLELLEVARGRVRPVYLLDAAFQAAVVALWLKRDPPNAPGGSEVVPVSSARPQSDALDEVTKDQNNDRYDHESCEHGREQNG